MSTALVLSVRCGQRCPSNGRSASSTSGLLAPSAQSSAGRAACSCRPWPPTPSAGQTIPLCTHTPCYSAATTASHHSRASEPSYSSMRGHPLSCPPRLRVVPFLGLAIIHRPSVLGAARTTWSRNGFHRMWTVCGEADSWVHSRSKGVPPYYAENNYSST